MPLSPGAYFLYIGFATRNSSDFDAPLKDAAMPANVNTNLKGMSGYISMVNDTNAMFLVGEYRARFRQSLTKHMRTHHKSSRANFNFFSLCFSQRFYSFNLEFACPCSNKSIVNMLSQFYKPRDCSFFKSGASDTINNVDLISCLVY